MRSLFGYKKVLSRCSRYYRQHRSSVYKYQHLESAATRRFLSSRKSDQESRLVDFVRRNFGEDEKILEGLRNYINQENLMYTNVWRNQNFFAILALGVVSGGLIMLGGLYFYIEQYPSFIEKFVIDKTVSAFAKSLSFEAKLRVFVELPEPNSPNQEIVIKETIKDFKETFQNKNEVKINDLINYWSSMIIESFNKIETTWLIAAKTKMRNSLLEEISENPNFKIEQKLNYLNDILPNSIELNLFHEYLFINSKDMIPSNYFKNLKPNFQPKSCDLGTKFLINSIAFFPGPIHKLIRVLIEDSNKEITSFKIWKQIFPTVSNSDFEKKISSFEPSSDDGSIRMKKLKSYLTGSTEYDFDRNNEFKYEIRKVPGYERIKKIFLSLSTEMKDFVLFEALTLTIKNLKIIPSFGEISILQLYEKSIDEGLINSLRQDTRIDEDILREVKNIFMSLPPKVQARVLLTAIKHPVASQIFESSKNKVIRKKEDFASLVKQLLVSGGVVSIKLGQMLAEHPRMPVEYQQILSSLREDNERMSLTQFWFSLPTVIQQKISYVGSCLGTGSVKQVHKVKYLGDDLACCVLRYGVEDEALSAISALETSPEIGPIAKRVGRLVFGECNLYAEGEALNEFSLTSIGQHKKFRVVKVIHQNPKCLIEQVAPLTSIATYLDNQEKYPKQEVEEVKALLTEYHKTIFKAFTENGFVHSDIHLGNASIDRDENGKFCGFVLFDVGQFEKIDVEATKAIMWTIASVGNATTRKVLKYIAMKKLAAVSKVDVGKDKLKLLLEAYEEAIQPNEKGELPEKKIAYLLLLRNAERLGVVLPKGSFPVAKMIDCIDSQQDQYLLHDTLVDSTVNYLKAKLTFYDIFTIFNSNFL